MGAGELNWLEALTIHTRKSPIYEFGVSRNTLYESLLLHPLLQGGYCFFVSILTS